METSELAPLLEQYISTREAEGEIPESRPELAQLPPFPWLIQDYQDGHGPGEQ